MGRDKEMQKAYNADYYRRNKERILAAREARRLWKRQRECQASLVLREDGVWYCSKCGWVVPGSRPTLET